MGSYPAESGHGDGGHGEVHGDEPNRGRGCRREGERKGQGHEEDRHCCDGPDPPRLCRSRLEPDTDPAAAPEVLIS
jgi:hypothetical protein